MDGEKNGDPCKKYQERTSTEAISVSIETLRKEVFNSPKAEAKQISVKTAMMEEEGLIQLLRKKSVTI